MNGDEFPWDSFIREAAKRMDRSILGDTPRVEQDPGTEVTFRKVGVTLPVSDWMAMEYGLIPDTRPPLPKPSLRERFRRSVSAWWYDHGPHIHLGPCPREDYDE